MDIKKQTDYWLGSAFDDIETAEILLRNRKVLYALFLCHLSVEKAIKAHIVVITNKVPPRVHNLSYLLEFTELNYQIIN